jgi:beta-glucosidase
LGDFEIFGLGAKGEEAILPHNRMKRVIFWLVWVCGLMGQTPEQRAAEMVARMSLAEKVLQMQNNAPAIPRLNIPAYDWWNEALHGDARAGNATVFPQAIGLAATWDTALEQRIADAISTEARAKYNDAIQHDNHRRYYGLTFWSPNINIFRDPRWGRGQETYGEDPYLTSQMALAFIQGMQGHDAKYFKTIATAKHFAVHSGPEVSRHQFDARVSQTDLDDTYLYAFRKALSAGNAYSVMCAYNSLFGSPACASDFLLKDELRGRWNFKGYVVSDCGAVSDIFEGHQDAGSMAEAAAKAVNAGTDLTCGTEYKHLPEAVESGLISEATIDQSLVRLFTARIRLGMFDPPASVPFSGIGMEQVSSAEHRDLALQAARESIVLLKNEKHMLPLTTIPKTIAVVGPAADDPDVMLGNYYGTPSRIVTPLAGLQQVIGSRAKIRWALGSLYAGASAALIPSANLRAPGGQFGVLAEYFNNDKLEGAPVLTRPEPQGYFVYEMRRLAVVKRLPQPTFSVRWTTNLHVDATGDYDLGLARQECDSCIGTNTWRLYMDGKELVNQTKRAANGYLIMRATVHLEAGHLYAIRAEYLQTDGGAGVELVWAPPADVSLAEAVKAVKESDLAVVCMGLNSRLEGEESPIQIPGFAHGDRTDINVPAQQEKLLRAVLDAGKPVIVVLLNGSALAAVTAQERAQAILETWYGGQEGGLAIAETILGKYNPGGRLPVTFYESAGQLPDFSDYSMKGRTYRYFEGKALYKFGYGLSYSEFQYSDLKFQNLAEGVLVSATVKNVSGVAGDEVAQVYVSNPATVNAELKAFKRVHLNAGQSETLVFPIAKAEIHAEQVSVGGGQPDEQSLKGTLPK